MPSLPGISYRSAIKAFKKAGFVVKKIRGKDTGGHTTMVKEKLVIQIPRHNPINAYTMAKIISYSGLTIEEFKKLL